VLEDARDTIMALLGGRGAGPDRDRLVFTSGASEANQLAIVGMTAAADAPGEVLFSRRDHPSIVNAAMAAGRRGWRLRELALDAHDGTASAAVVEALAQPYADDHSHTHTPRIVSLTSVCGQTGSIDHLPAPDGCPDGTNIHVDATQAAGLMRIVFRDLSAATLTLAPHKFGGPRGIGGLLVRGGVAIQPFQAGTQEHSLRGGTEAVSLAAGFARALELAAADRDQLARHLAGLRERLESRLADAAREAGIKAVVIAASGRRSPHISTIAFPGLDRQSLAMAADLAGVCLATGTACASGSSEPAPAVVAMGLAPEVVRGAVRLSIGRTTSIADIDLAIARLAPLLRRRG
jgi:cysteine desulfurase